MPGISVIIPAFNEQENIQAGRLAEVAGWLKTYRGAAELIVVDDGSADATVTLAGSIAGRVISIPHSGKAAALMAGMAAAVYDHILFLDMDQATPITEADKILTVLEKSADVVMGGRGLLRKHAPLSRYILSLGHVFFRRLLLRLSFLDTQCGFKACTRQAAREILEHLIVYNPGTMAPVRGSRVNSGFDTEFLFVAFRIGFRIAEVPVQWNYQRARRINLFREAWYGLQDLFAIAWQNMKGNYTQKKVPD
jgi:dolichyl-phosphate beta-glucosyltransferase